MAAPPELNPDATEEILLRLLPADDPERLPHFALVCKLWLDILTDRGFLPRYREFLREYRAFHGSPPLLGLLHRLHPFQGDPAPLFFPTAKVPAFPHPVSSYRHPRPLDCRHGRVFIDMLDGKVERFLVWDPVTGDHHRLRGPDIRDFALNASLISCSAYSAAVICAAADCNHLDCHGGPFRVALVTSDESKNLIWASVYSSETRSWSKPTSLDNGRISLDNGRISYVNAMRGALIGDEVYFTATLKRDEGLGIVRYDWRRNCLSLVNPPAPHKYNGVVALMVMDDTLGYAGIKDSSLYIWSMMVNSEGAAEWVQSRVIELGTMIPMSQPRTVVYRGFKPVGASAVGFAEGLGVVFVDIGAGLFMIELKSGRARQVAGPGIYYSILPYMSFYTPDRVIAGED